MTNTSKMYLATIVARSLLPWLLLRLQSPALNEVLRLLLESWAAFAIGSTSPDMFRKQQMLSVLPRCTLDVVHANYLRDQRVCEPWVDFKVRTGINS